MRTETVSKNIFEVGDIIDLTEGFNPEDTYGWKTRKPVFAGATKALVLSSIFRTVKNRYAYQVLLDNGKVSRMYSTETTDLTKLIGSLEIKDFILKEDSANAEDE